jgi:hypothetical protein
VDKVNFHFPLLKARFPDLYQEAEDKIAGGVAPKDVIADWLNELVYCRRDLSPAPLPEEKDTSDDIDFAKDVMAGLE